MAEADQDDNTNRLEDIKDQVMKIASAKDLDLLMAELKGNSTDALILAAT